MTRARSFTCPLRPKNSSGRGAGARVVSCRIPLSVGPIASARLALHAAVHGRPGRSFSRLPSKLVGSFLGHCDETRHFSNPPPTATLAGDRRLASIAPAPSSSLLSPRLCKSQSSVLTSPKQVQLLHGGPSAGGVRDLVLEGAPCLSATPPD